MEVRTFRASVQYNDWKGTSAADSADDAGPRIWLEQQGHIKEGEFLLGVRLWAGENNGTHRDPVSIEFLLAQPGDHDNVKHMIDQCVGPVMVRVVRVSMNLQDFFAQFKRLSIVMSAHNLLGEREYTFLDY